MKKIYVLFGMLIFVALNAATLSVALDGSQAYSVIQDAIDEAISGDTILVYPGTYYENLNFNGKSLTLASLELTTGDVAYKYTTIIDGNQIQEVIMINNYEADVCIRGFTITGGAGVYVEDMAVSVGGGIVLGMMSNRKKASIINCVIKQNKADYGGGIWSSSCNLYLSGVSIHDNKANFGGGLLHQNAMSQSYDLIFDPNNRCSIYSNIGSRGCDIYLNYAINYVEAVLDTFTVATPSYFYAAALVSTYGAPYPYHFDILNSVHEEVNADHYVAPWGDNNNDGLSPATPLKSIFEASYRIASDPLDPKTIHVANGYYSESANDQHFLLPVKSNCNLLGESKDGVILDVEGQLGAISIDCFTENVSISNMTINNLIRGFSGLNSENISIENITIEGGNTAYRGITLNNSKDIAIENVLINNLHSNKHVYGLQIASFRGGEVKLKNIEVSNLSSTQYLKGVNFTNRAKSKIYIDGLKIHHLRSFCEDDYNTIMQIAPEGHNPEFTLRLEMKNSAFYDNYQRYVNNMGSCRSIGDTIFVSNCTFAGNEGGGLAMRFVGTTILENNVFWNPELNYELSIHHSMDPLVPPLDAIGRALFNNNCIRGGIGGIYNNHYLNEIIWRETNIEDDPLFSEEGNIPYTLSANSPLIDIGAPTPWEEGAVDAAGNERIWDGDGDGIAIIDIGAYEYQPINHPSTLVANQIYNEVELTWQMPINDERGLSGYRIYRNDEAQGEVSDPSQWTFTDVLTANGIYEYYVVALYGLVESPASNRVTVEITTISNEDEVQTPPVHKLSLSPNPFRDILVIRYHLEKHSDAELSIYNLRGQKIRRLQKESLPVGEQVLAWDGCDEYGTKMASGIYLMQLKVDGRRVSAEKFVKY